MATIFPLHRKLWEEGRIDLLTTPYYHPILPILLEKEAIRESNPVLALPKEPIAWPEDARWQVRSGKAYFQALFGKEPLGMWPPEGAVSQKAAELYAEEGIGFLVTDEAILGRSGFPVNPLTLTRPYRVEKDGRRVVLFFRHRNLSDRIGFSYSQMPAERAVEDLIAALLEIRRQVIGQNPEAVLTLALDGENAWENYRKTATPSAASSTGAFPRSRGRAPSRRYASPRCWGFPRCPSRGSPPGAGPGTSPCGRGSRRRTRPGTA